MVRAAIQQFERNQPCFGCNSAAIETAEMAVERRAKLPHPVKKRPEGFERKGDVAGYCKSNAKDAHPSLLAKAVGHDADWNEF